jgi:hypothetical protein
MTISNTLDSIEIICSTQKRKRWTALEKRIIVQETYLPGAAFGNDEISEYQKYSIDYRICIGPQQGKKVFTLQTLPPSEDESHGVLVGRVGGFSLHAGVFSQSKSAR